MKKIGVTIHRHKNMLVVFGVAFIPRMVLCLFADPIRTPSDEMGTLAIASVVSGLDWNQVTSAAGYYGFGSTILFSFILKLFSNPYIIYRLYLIAQALLQSFGAIICMHILKKYFEKLPEKMRVLFAITTNYLVMTRALVIYNEHMLILLAWLLAWILLYLSNNCKNYKKRLKGTALLVFLMIYGLTVHIRFLVVWIAILIIVLIKYFYKRETLVDFRAFLPGIILGYLGINRVLDYVQNHFWVSETGEAIRNTEISTNGIKLLLNPSSWQAWLNTIIGEINTGNIITGGLIILGFVLALVGIYQIFLTFVTKSNKRLDENILILVLFFGLCIIGTIVAQSFIWLPETSDVINVGVVNSCFNYGVKAFTYVRYYGPYCGPFVLGALLYLTNSYDKVKQIWKWTACAFALIQIYWLTCIVPYLYNTKIGIALEVFYPFSFTSLYEKETVWYIFIAALIISLLIFFCLYIFHKKSKLYIPVIILFISLFYQYIYNACNYDYPMQQEQVAKVSESYELIQNNTIKLPHEIYVYDTSSLTDHQTFFTYQFYFNSNKVIPGLPERNIEEAVVFVNYPNEECKILLEEGFKCKKIADNQMIFVKGKNLQNKFEEKQIILETNY